MRRLFRKHLSVLRSKFISPGSDCMAVNVKEHQIIKGEIPSLKLSAYRSDGKQQSVIRAPLPPISEILPWLKAPIGCLSRPHS